MRPADAARPRLLHAVDAVQRLGPLGPARPAGHATTATTTRRDGEEQLWRIAPGEPPAALHRRATAGSTLQHLGHGHRQPGPDRRRLARGLPDQPGRQQLQTLADGRRRPDVPRHRARSAASPPHQPFAGGDALPRPPGTPSSRTSTTTASSTCSSPRATSSAHARLRREGPEQPAPRPARRHVRRGRRGRRHRRLRARPRRGAGRPQPRRPARPRRGQRAARTSGSGATSAPATPTTPAADGPLAGGPARSSRARTATRSAPGSRSRSASRIMRRELTVGGGHAGGQLGWIHFGLGDGRPRPRSASSGPTARSGRGCPCTRDQFVDRSSAGATAVHAVAPAGG